MSVARHHAEWLSLVEVSGPFLSMPVLLRVFPEGLDRFQDEHDIRSRLHVASEEWLDSQSGPAGDVAIHRAWVRHVLREVLEFDDGLLVDGQSIPANCSVSIPEHGERLAPDLVLVDPPGRPSAGKPRLFVTIVPKSQKLDGALVGHRWKASPATRMMTLLHSTRGAVRIGLVTNGDQWMLVHAQPGETTSYVSFFANLWVEEPLILRAMHTVAGARRLFGVADSDTLEALFTESAENQQEVTDQLGLQVRRAVEVLIQTIDRIDRDRGRSLLKGLDEQQLYESAVTVMMRLVFLFAAEERGLLLLGDPLFDQHYAVSTLREQLQSVADTHGGEVLQRRHDAWSRLLATFRAVHGGVEHEAMRLPAYGGSLFDPDRFPFLEGRAAGTNYAATAANPLPVDNLTVLDLLNSLQLLQVKVPGGGPAESRRISFRALDVEQIGHVYEGLLDHMAKRAKGPVVSLRGAKDVEPEIELAELERRRKETSTEQLVAYLVEETGRSAKAIQKDLEYRPDDDEARYFATACDNDASLISRVAPWAGVIRRDVHNLPVIVPAGSVYVTEGTARRSSGTHYTPRSLTEPVVQYTLEPLVYVGPAEGLPKEQWKLRTAKELLGLRVCDLAMGSGAFLVQACRYLSERIVEAWEQAERDSGGKLVITPDGELSKADPGERALPGDAEERLAIARRHVADRCLYGVDINPMAVEMAKLSLWLVTLQKDRPFTFVDHALKSGDSLLGVTQIDQIEKFTLREGEIQELFASARLREVTDGAAQMRRELESFPSDHYDQIERKRKLHAQSEAATAMTRAIGDSLIGFELATANSSYQGERGALAERIRPLISIGDATGVAEVTGKELGRRRPFHWPVEFPEVVAHGGFDAIIGNPPFMHGSIISGTFGGDYATLLKRTCEDSTGKIDYAVYFLRRAHAVAQKRGSIGVVATSKVSEGAARRAGIDYISTHGRPLIREVTNLKWPGGASVLVGQFVLSGATIDDGSFAPTVYPSQILSGPKTYLGAKPDSLGFMLSPASAKEFLHAHPTYSAVLRPYHVGDDINNLPDLAFPRRYAIDFTGLTLEEARAYPELLEVVDREVRPKRETLKRGSYAERWWQFTEPQAALFSSIRKKEEAIAIGRVSRFFTPRFVPSKHICSDKVVVFVSDEYWLFGLLASSVHFEWALRWSGTHGSGTASYRDYKPTECARTFPLPYERLEPLAAIGQTLRKTQDSFYADQRCGPTDLYMLLHDPERHEPHFNALRDLHAKIDIAAAAAYGWTDLDLKHDFYPTKQGVRFTITDSARRAVVDRLVALNRQRAEDELKTGASANEKGKRRSATRRQAESMQLGFLGQEPPIVTAPQKGAGISAHAAALLRAMDEAVVPLSRTALITSSQLPDSAWAAAISELKAQNLVEQTGEKRGASYSRKKS